MNKMLLLDNHMLGEMSPVLHGYNIKNSKDHIGCGESLYNEKGLDLAVLKKEYLLTGDKHVVKIRSGPDRGLDEKWLFDIIRLYNQETYPGNLCVELRVVSITGTLCGRFLNT